MALIEDVESGKKNIRDYLENARSNPEGRAYELIEFLEDGDVLSEKFPNRIISRNYRTDRTEYNAFCKAYMIHLFNTFIVNPEDAEIMLVSFNYLPEYEHEKRAIQRRALYAREKYEPRHPEKKLGKSIGAKSRSLYDQESRIMNELSKVLAEQAVALGGTLDIVDEVLTERELAEVVETVDPVLYDVEPDELPEPHTPSQLIPLMEVEQVKNFRQNCDPSGGALSPMPDVYVNNTADATNVTNVQVIVVMPETAKPTTSTRKQPPIEPKTKTLAPYPRAKIPALPSPKPTPIPHRPPTKSCWLIVLALIVVGLGVIYMAFSHLPDSEEPSNPAIVGPEDTEFGSDTTDTPDNSGPGNRVQIDRADDATNGNEIQVDGDNDSGQDTQIVENTSPGINIQPDDPSKVNSSPGLHIQFNENTSPGLNIQKDQE